MTLLFVNQHYTPDVAATGQHLADLAEHLTARGFAVEVFASRGQYVAGKVEASPGEVLNGVRVTRLRSSHFGRGSHLGRIIDYAGFYVRVLMRLLGRRRHDGVIFLTTPPLLSFVGRIAKAVRGQRYGIWSMDLHPEAELASGMLRERSLLARLLRWLSTAGYQDADFVVALGPYMRDRLVRAGVDPSRAHIVHVWSDSKEVAPVAKADNPLVRELGLDDRFVVMYSGNAGIVHDFRHILEAMRRLKDDPLVHFLFVGHGPQRRHIEEFVARNGIGNFDYRPYFDRDLLRYSLSLGDAHLISLRPEFVGISVPAKLYGIMAAGRPPLFVGPQQCESADAIREGRCGRTVESSSASAADEIVATLRAWSRDPGEVAALGQRAREMFLGRYERKIGSQAFESIIRETWGPAVSKPPSGRPEMASPSAAFS